MRLLHTSDWHLGQRFNNHERVEEHALALDWVLQTVADQQVDILVVAGDIFDTFNPSNNAQQLYYNFLVRLSQTNCQHAVIIGGNHDSPSMLEAPKELLKVLKVHVVGAAPENNEEAVLRLKNNHGEPLATVAAIPFLRDRDLVFAKEEESGLERVDKIRQAIKMHFEVMGKACTANQVENIPVIGTGHLFAYGAKTEEKQNNIYIGDEANIRIEDIPEAFHYVALGHIHRPQAIGNKEHVRYCGSIIPLDFSEVADPKEVVIVDFEGNKLINIQRLNIPVFRRLKSIKDNVDNVKERLVEFAQRHENELTPWVEVIIEDDTIPVDVDKEIRSLAAELHLEVLRVKLSKQNFEAKGLDASMVDLSDIDILEVFEKKCERAAIPSDQFKKL
ncbi:MAG: exonuclease SbcCD subunit D C-terminal domain-containing protein, partial [Saprospiraceae bacterium]|nr:exonuclease SbcCD subunit D C-terminal domain-containing protein [Saprospiraceae bacterium]